MPADSDAPPAGPTCSMHPATASHRPSIAAAIGSPTALSNLTSSLLLLSCFFLPHSLGCDGKSRAPLRLAESAFSSSTSLDHGVVLVVLWPYGLAVATLVGFVILVCRRPPRGEFTLVGIPSCAAAMLLVLWTLLLFSGQRSSRDAMLIAATVAPPATIVSARIWWLCRMGHLTAAATWGQSLLCVLAAFSLRWFWYPPVTRLQTGGILSIVAALLMMIASWTWAGRARYDLWDRSQPPAPFQVSLRQIIVAVTLVAVALTYWQLLGR